MDGLCPSTCQLLAAPRFILVVVVVVIMRTASLSAAVRADTLGACGMGVVKNSTGIRGSILASTLIRKVHAATFRLAD